jgi:hypothetical protein
VAPAGPAAQGRGLGQGPGGRGLARPRRRAARRPPPGPPPS